MGNLQVGADNCLRDVSSHPISTPPESDTEVGVYPIVEYWKQSKVVMSKKWLQCQSSDSGCDFMANQEINHSGPSAKLSRGIDCSSSVFQIAELVVLVLLGALGLGTQTVGGTLKPGDIIYADSGNGIDGGSIIRVDPDTGEQTVISSGRNLIRPFDVVFDDQGQIITSDTGLCCTLIRIDPNNGDQTVIADNSREVLGVPFGIAVSADFGVLVANAQNLVRVDPTTGESRTVSSGGQFVAPLGVALAGNGQAFVLNRASPPAIVRVDLGTGIQTVVSLGGYLNSPQAIVARNHDLYVTDVATPDGNFGIGRVIHVDLRTGAQSVVSAGGLLVGPVGIDLSESGQIVVGDPYTINPDSPEVYDGGIIRIDPRSGAQSLIARGRQGIVNPRGVAVVRGQTHGVTLEAGPQKTPR